MPQENLILRCYSCHRFQVHLVKKAKTWKCKLCNSKQSFKQSFGKGSGKDCRIHAMKLNEEQFMREEKTNNDIFQFEEAESNEKHENSLGETENVKSKWLDFIDVQELPVSNKKENEEMNSSYQNHYVNKRRKISGENNNALIGYINNSYESHNAFARNVEVVNNLDTYFKENSLYEKDLNRIEIKEMKKSTSNINKYSKYTSSSASEPKLYNSNNVCYKKQSEKNLKIFEDNVAAEELDEILRF